MSAAMDDATAISLAMAMTEAQIDRLPAEKQAMLREFRALEAKRVKGDKLRPARYLH
jgi:hypothetical protein